MPHSGKFGSSFAIHKMNLARYIQSKTISRFFTQVRDLVHQEVSELDLRSHVHPPRTSLVSHVFATTEGMNSNAGSSSYHLLESRPAKLVLDFFRLAPVVPEGATPSAVRPGRFARSSFLPRSRLHLRSTHTTAPLSRRNPSMTLLMASCTAASNATPISPDVFVDETHV